MYEQVQFLFTPFSFPFSGALFIYHSLRNRRYKITEWILKKINIKKIVLIFINLSKTFENNYGNIHSGSEEKYLSPLN